MGSEDDTVVVAGRRPNRAIAVYRDGHGRPIAVINSSAEAVAARAP